jgi:hypothetical protein
MSVVSSWRRRTSGASSRKGGKGISTPVCARPAELTRMSMPPAASASTNAWSRSVRSATCAETSAPSARSSPARSSMRLVVDVIATRAPRRVSRRAQAKPIPASLPQPVTRAARPEKSKGFELICGRRGYRGPSSAVAAHHVRTRVAEGGSDEEGRDSGARDRAARRRRGPGAAEQADEVKRRSANAFWYTTEWLSATSYRSTV